MAALRAWPGRSNDVLCIEYVLIPGVNDDREHASCVASDHHFLAADERRLVWRYLPAQGQPLAHACIVTHRIIRAVLGQSARRRAASGAA